MPATRKMRAKACIAVVCTLLEANRGASDMVTFRRAHERNLCDPRESNQHAAPGADLMNDVFYVEAARNWPSA